MPLIVIVLAAHVAVTPDGKPVAVPIPVAPVVICVIGIKKELIHRVWKFEGVATEFKGNIVTVVVVWEEAQSPLGGML